MKIAISSWRISKGEDAQALLLGALCMALIMGAMALAVDVGYMQYRQTQLQTAADAAAIAAGLEIGNCQNAVCANMKTAAEKALIEDGITSATVVPTSNCSVPNSTGLAMILNVAPCVLASDPNKNNTYMAEVVLTEPQNTFFGNVFGIHRFNLSARAEAGEAYYLTGGGGFCIYSNYIMLNSGSDLELNNCGIYDGGDLGADSGAKTTAYDFVYLGSWSIDNCNGNSCKWTLGNGQAQPTHTNQSQADPLKNLVPPTAPPTSPTNTQTPDGTVTLQPGSYPQGFNINSGTTVNIAPGLYYMDGTLTIDDGANLTCSTCVVGGAGVTFYFAGGSFQANSGSTVQVSAPATGYTTYTQGGVTYNDIANMLIWGGPNAANMEIDSGSRSTVVGTIYLPTQTLTLNSGSGVTMQSLTTWPAVDVNSLMVDGGNHFNLNAEGQTMNSSGTAVLGSFALAE